MTLGFIGLGIMGTPAAGRLLAAGHAMLVHTRRAVPPALLDAGAVACANAADVARQADTVFLMRPDTPDVAAVLFGDIGVAAGLTALQGGPDRRLGKTVVDDCKTLHPRHRPVGRARGSPQSTASGHFRRWFRQPRLPLHRRLANAALLRGRSVTDA